MSNRIWIFRVVLAGLMLAATLNVVMAVYNTKSDYEKREAAVVRVWERVEGRGDYKSAEIIDMSRWDNSKWVCAVEGNPTAGYTRILGCEVWERGDQ